jgi:6,7-dimethyl-8-ribityllumazine synthase
MNKVAIVVANYYPEITSGLLSGVQKTLDKKFSSEIYEVSGAWEIVYKINNLIEVEKINKFIAIGVICKGDTDHYEYISSSVSSGLMNTIITKNVYIANCVLNVLNLTQAEERAGNSNNKGSEAALSLNKLFINT